MECIYFNFLQNTKEHFYKNESGETETVNIHLCNEHSSAVAVQIRVSNKVNSTGIPIVKESMAAGDTITLTDVALNDQMFIHGIADIADKVGVKVDRV